MIRLWIKGSIKEAEEAAKLRNIPIQGLMAHSKRPECWCDTEDSNRLAVVQWFCEPVKCYEGTGYPSGTLLLHD